MKFEVIDLLGTLALVFMITLSHLLAIEDVPDIIVGLNGLTYLMTFAYILLNICSRKGGDSK